MSVYSDASIKLIKDIKRCKDSKLLYIPTYRDDLVREVKMEVNSLYSDIKKWTEEVKGLSWKVEPTDAERAQITGLETAMSMHQLAIFRSKRCLLAYLKWRLDELSGYIWELGAGSSAPSSLPSSGIMDRIFGGRTCGAVKKNLSSLEIDFATRYAKLTTEYKNHYLDLDLGTCTEIPPKDPWIEVRVLRDCGTVETERGAVFRLKENSTQYVRRTDVESFITKGWLQHIG